MGRNAPEQQYEIIVCKTQNATDLITSGNVGFVGGIAAQFPLGATGTDVTGTVFLNSGDSSFTPYPDKCLVTIFEGTNQAILDDPTNSLVGTGLSLKNWRSGRGLNIIYTGSVFSTGGTDTGNRELYSLKVTGVQQTSTGVSVFPSTTSGAFVKYIELNDDLGLILTYRQRSTSVGVSGNAVLLTAINHTSTTGVTTGTTVTVPQSNNLFTGVPLAFPAMELDLSYTGSTKRVLVGYQAATGATSGQLCAVLAEITSGGSISFGDPVVIRSTVSSGNYCQGINVTYHSGGNSNCFVIATAVNNLTHTSGAQASGELIACNPPSGVVLSGYFGTPVVALDSDGTGTTTGNIFDLNCLALNTYTGSESYGLAVAVGSGSTVRSNSFKRQLYQVSGTVITTGVLLSGSCLLNESGNAVIANNVVSGYDMYARTGIVQRSTSSLYEISSIVTSSGLVCYTDYGTHAASGQSFTNFFHVPYSLTDTGRTQYTTITGSTIRGGGIFATPLANAFFVLPGNPYGGAHGSFVTLKPGNSTQETTKQGIVFITYKTTTGYFPSGGIGSGGVFGGSFFEGIRFPSPVLYSQDRNRSRYTLSTEDINDPGSFTLPSIAFTGGQFNIVKLLGNYPSYTGITFTYSFENFTGANNVGFYTIKFPSTTGEINYKILKDVLKYPAVYTEANSADVFGIVVDTLNLGMVINPNSTQIDAASNSGTFAIDSGLVSNTTVVVKKPLNEKAKYKLIQEALHSFTLKDTHTIFE